MYDALCTYPLRSDLFALAIHPSESLIALGLASGHVQVTRVPVGEVSTPSKPNSNTIETQWRTRRHKGSCRSLCYSPNGEHLLSTGSDGIVKIAAAETGVVSSKIAVPEIKGHRDPPTVLRTLSDQTLLLATDSSALYVYDIRLPSSSESSSSSKPVQTHHPHADYLTSISTLPPTSTSDVSSQWLSTGGTTVAVTDLRRGVLVQSEDQGDELFSSALTENGKAVVAGEKGILRVWNVGVWDDNETTINVTAGLKTSAEALASVPGTDMVAIGTDDGSIRFVQTSGKRLRLLDDLKVTHNDLEGVGCLGFVNGGRMISGGGTTVKVWEERHEHEKNDEDIEGATVNGNGHAHDSDDSENESSADEESKRKKKRRKRGKGKPGASDQHLFNFKGLN